MSIRKSCGTKSAKHNGYSNIGIWFYGHKSHYNGKIVISQYYLFDKMLAFFTKSTDVNVPNIKAKCVVYHLGGRNF
jgi:hypothetical protein